LLAAEQVVTSAAAAELVDIYLQAMYLLIQEPYLL
jgi:hypothetical protein